MLDDSGAVVTQGLAKAKVLVDHGGEFSPVLRWNVASQSSPSLHHVNTIDRLLKARFEQSRAIVNIDDLRQALRWCAKAGWFVAVPCLVLDVCSTREAESAFESSPSYKYDPLDPSSSQVRIFKLLPPTDRGAPLRGSLGIESFLADNALRYD